jgi:hypothetical protein
MYNAREGRPVPSIEKKVKEGHDEEFIHGQDPLQSSSLFSVRPQKTPLFLAL